jgi:hypothetical protein
MSYEGLIAEARRWIAETDRIQMMRGITRFVEQLAGALEASETENARLKEALEMHGELAHRAAETLREIADCDETGHTGMTWAQEEARKALKDMRSIGGVN